MTKRNLTAWNVELTELGHRGIPGWSFNDDVYGSSGPPYDLAPHLVQIELDDANADGTIAVHSGDTITLDGVAWPIGLIYYRDQATIDGTVIETVTLYIGTGFEIPITFPILNGTISGAYPGAITSSQGTGSFNTPIATSDFACFTRGTLIGTPDGAVAVETLAAGDLVMTKDHGAQEIRWIGRATLGGSRAGIPENLRPVRIAAGALGGNVPDRDLLVSPQHRMLVTSRIARRMFGTGEILVAAKALLALDRVEIAVDMRQVEYFHILFDRHEIVVANGAETESLHTGPEALRSLGEPARREILAIFPELASPDHAATGARMFAPGRRARRLAERHAESGQPLN